MIWYLAGGSQLKSRAMFDQPCQFKIMESKKLEQQEVEDLIDLNQAPAELSGDESKQLAEFLKKVSMACDGDKSVPSFVGAQVQDWLKEMEEEAGDDNEVKADLGGS